MITTAASRAWSRRSIDACTTRLRLGVVDAASVDAAALATLGAMGVIRPSATAVQVVLGPIADQVAGEIRAFVGTLGAARAPLPPAPVGTAQALPVAPLLTLLGGRENIVSVSAAVGRLLVTVRQAPDLSRGALDRAGVLDAGTTAAGTIHLLVGDSAQATAVALLAG
jgi:PTS system N-acetylglucosamine-specific IIC component